MNVNRAYIINRKFIPVNPFCEKIGEFSRSRVAAEGGLWYTGTGEKRIRETGKIGIQEAGDEYFCG